MNKEKPYVPSKAEVEKAEEMSIDIKLKAIKEFEKMKARVGELEKNDSRSDSEDDEHALLKRRIERAEDKENSITTLKELVDKYEDLPRSSCKRAGIENDELTFLPNGEVVLLERVKDYDYDEQNWELIDRREAREMLVTEHARLEKEISEMNTKLSDVDRILRDI